MNGIFTIEVVREGENMQFHLKTVFWDSTPERANAGQLPAVLQFCHRQYVKLMMETSVRQLLR